MTNNISANTLFHFTKSVENLESILKNNFYPRLCYENFMGTILNAPPDIIELEKAIPMVCFCDLPLSQITKHTETYGEYALGLSKEWAIKNKINPVLYAYPNSDFSEIIKNLLINLPPPNKFENLTLKKNDFNNQLMSAIQYVKPYEGNIRENGKITDKKIRYYDEREWRFIPKFSEKRSVPMMLRRGGEDEKEAFIKVNNEIENLDKLHLSFEPNDIKLIVVKSEAEILSMVDKVIQLKRDKFSYSDVQILTTRITSLETISENY